VFLFDVVLLPPFIFPKFIAMNFPLEKFHYEQKYQNLVFSPKDETKPQPKFRKPFHDMVYLSFILFLVQTTFILHLPKTNPLKTSTKIKPKNPTKI
jgi:hypothetical protein